MSLGFSAGIGEYADLMGAFDGQIPSWYRDALKFLSEKGIWQRLIDIVEVLKMEPMIPFTLGQKLSVVALAIAYGAEFTFYDSSPANQSICRFLNDWTIDLEVPICELFTPLERMQLGLKN